MRRIRLSTIEAAQHLKDLGTPFTQKTLEVLRCRGRGPRYYKVGRKVFYDPTDLETFAQGQIVETVDTHRR